jgi:lysyl endopeptidase
MRTFLSLAGLGVALTLPSSALAQAGAGGTPPGIALGLAATEAVEVLPTPDVAALLAEDERNSDKLGPFRFGEGAEVAIGLSEGGEWLQLEDGRRLWRARVESPGAWSLNLIFDRFQLPAGAELYVYNDHGAVRGAFTAELNQPHGMFATEPLQGDALTLEYVEPQDGALGELRLSEVVHAYRDILGDGADGKASHTQSGVMKASGACNINVNCPLGANWQDQKRSSARLVMGGVLCSGALINNTAQDSKQYFLTANHCYSGNPATWVFNFNYESATCNGTTGTPQSVSGSTLKVKSSASDFCLVEITQDLPANYNLYYSGWSRSTTPATITHGIHHPQGDIKKICQDNDSAIAASFNGAPCWRVADWEQGVTEGGSSGSPLYDQNKRIVGQLFGGQATCSFLFNDYYGRFDVSMNNGLATFLDPAGTGMSVLDGIFDNQGNLPTAYCTGKLSSQGLVPAIDFTGTPSLATQNFQIFCSNGIPGSNGLALWGVGQNTQPIFNATLCVLPPLTRGPMQVFDVFGLVFSPIAVTAPMVGTTRYYQYWARDAAHPDGTGVILSNALEVPFLP